MNDSKYNGWANFETWKVALEVFDGYNPDEEDRLWSAEQFQEFAEEVIFQDRESDTLADSFARAFLAEVHWHEIADTLNEDAAQAPGEYAFVASQK